MSPQGVAVGGLASLRYVLWITSRGENGRTFEGFCANEQKVKECKQIAGFMVSLFSSRRFFPLGLQQISKNANIV